ncbi:MAG: 1-acyl-sn-glycerol-3-phosphate acyltransferase [Bacteroidota bacterium]
MLYYIIRPLTHFGLLAFCKNIYLSNTECLPKDRPVILACNHPSAFLEPCVIASFMKRPLHFLVRGDFFRHPFYRKLMYSLHLIPIYRSTNADYKDLKKNVGLMDIIGQKLNENITLMILVEGSASVKKGLRPIQKGIARLAFDVYEKYGREDLEIIPVGANFDYPTQFRLTPMINLGERILIKEYLTDYQENKSKAVRQLMLDVQAGMRQNIIHVEQEEDEELIEQQLLLYRNEERFTRFPIVKRDAERLKKEIQIAEQINQLPAENKSTLKQFTTDYFDQLQQQDLSDKAFFISKRWWRLPFLIFGLPLFIIGTLFNFPPIKMADQIAKKNVKKIQYYIPVVWAISNFGYFLYWQLLLLLTYFFLPQIWIWLTLSLPLLGYFSIIYKEQLEQWKELQKFKQLEISERQELKQKRRDCYLTVK